MDSVNGPALREPTGPESFLVLRDAIVDKIYSWVILHEGTPHRDQNGRLWVFETREGAMQDSVIMELPSGTYDFYPCSLMIDFEPEETPDLIETRHTPDEAFCFYPEDINKKAENNEIDPGKIAKSLATKWWGRFISLEASVELETDMRVALESVGGTG